MSNKKLIIIAGPTAVGKSSVALKLALKYQAEIFSADSRQVYKELNIGTAKPTTEELSSVKHHFINHISIQENYSAGTFEKEIIKALEVYFILKDVAIVCGGTGLYIRALLEGLDDFPDIPDEILFQLNKKLEIGGIEVLQSELKLKDPTYYDLVDLANPRRLIRALSLIEFTKQPYSTLLNQKEVRNLPYSIKQILLEKPRGELYETINNRVDTMIDNGLEKEAYNLMEYKESQALNTVGYQEWNDYFEGNRELTLTIDAIKQNSRRYAKRQITWFNKYGDWNKFSPKDMDKIIDYINE